MNKWIIFSALLLIFISGCSNEKPVQNLSCSNYTHGETWQSDCNTCSCHNGTISCTEKACMELENPFENFKEQLNLAKFNSNLKEFEKKWLISLEEMYPTSRIYHIKTEEFNCKDCYEVSFKKDREIIKIKVLNGEKKSQRTVTDDIKVDIENEDVCTLFQGTWNECPKLCTTDETACQNQCGLPVCEFEENKIILKEEGEVCGGLDKGDCMFGFTCKYESSSSDYGVCVKK